jgi:hypothetical protein
VSVRLHFALLLHLIQIIVALNPLTTIQ